MRPSGPTASVFGSSPTRTSQRLAKVSALMAATVPLSGFTEYTEFASPAMLVVCVGAAAVTGAITVRL
ncbi:hypothetical protein D9M68_766270 [compost metagenome]